MPGRVVELEAAAPVVRRVLGVEDGDLDVDHHAAEGVDHAPEAVDVDGHVVLDVEPVELAERPHQRLEATGLVRAPREEVGPDAGLRVERVDLVVVLAAQGPIGRPVARQGHAGGIARQRDEGHPSGGRVDAHRDHRVGQVAVAASGGVVCADEQDVQALLAVPILELWLRRRLGIVRLFTRGRRQAGIGGCLRGRTGLERGLESGFLVEQDEVRVLGGQHLGVWHRALVAAATREVVQEAVAGQSGAAHDDVAGDEDDDEGHQTGRGEHPAAGGADAGVLRQAPGVEHRGEPVEEVHDDDDDERRGVHDHLARELVDVLTGHVDAERDDAEGGQESPQEGPQPAPQVGMAEPGVEEREEGRGEGAPLWTHGDVRGDHRPAS